MNGIMWEGSPPSGRAQRSTSDMKNAPMMPSTDPKAAPISLFRLTCSSRTSKNMMQTPMRSPANAVQIEELF